MIFKKTLVTYANFSIFLWKCVIVCKLDFSHETEIASYKDARRDWHNVIYIYCCHSNSKWKILWVILKNATSHNHLQPPTTTNNHPQPSKSIHDHPQLSRTTHNNPQSPKKPPTATQKAIHNHPQPSTTTQKLPKKAKTCHKHVYVTAL